MPGIRHIAAFHTDRDSDGRPLSAADRERLLKPYLPPTPSDQSSRSPSPAPTSQVRSKRSGRPRRVRPALRHGIYLLLFTVIHAIFSVYVRVRQVYRAIVDRILAVVYYHHRTPEFIQRDVKSLSKVPRHLSVILELRDDGGGSGDRLETLVNEACEVAAWSACAGVSMLSIYERTGILKSSLPHLHRRISKALTSYYGNSPLKPTLSLRAPHHSSYSPPHSPEPSSNGTHDRASQPHLTILLLSATDGRQTLVDLTRTLASMSQDGKLSPSDISQELIDAEITESVMGEPDLLIIFGDRVVLDGYPPWQVRLTEIFCVPENSVGVGYSVFLRALYRYARAEMRFGR